MQITLNFTKTVHENAALYFEKAKKAKKRLEGAKKAIEISTEKLASALKEKDSTKKEIEEKMAVAKNVLKKEWYEKFHWFFSSEGFLVIGGRDAITNEIVIKKHTEQKDMVFHTDMQGSPFFVIKTTGKKPGENTIAETAAATAIYSRAWKLGFVNVGVSWVTPEQVSKTANPGEYIERGAFVVRGKTNSVEHDMHFAIGVKEGKIIAGPYLAIQTHAEKVLEIVQGEEKPSDLAKQVKGILKAGSLDEIIRMLPSGNGRVKK